MTRSAACSNDRPEISSTILLRTGSLLVGGGGGEVDVDAAASVASARAPYPPYVAGLHSPIDVERRFFNE